MYSGSRGILYTAPPKPDESNDDATADAAAEPSTEEADAVTPSEPDEPIAADD